MPLPRPVADAEDEDVVDGRREGEGDVDERHHRARRVDERLAPVAVGQVARRRGDERGAQLRDHREEGGESLWVVDLLDVAEHEENEGLEGDAHVIEDARDEDPEEVRVRRHVDRVRRDHLRP